MTLQSSYRVFLITCCIFYFVMNFNSWKNYIFSAYLSFSLSKSIRRPHAYVIFNHQKSRFNKNAIKFSFASLSKSSKFIFEQFKQQRIKKLRQEQQQQIEKNRITKEKIEAFSCKRCSVKYFNNIKLHEHVRTKYAKKSSTSQTSVSSSVSFISSTVSLTTSKKSISWIEIISKSKSFTTSSRLSRSTALSTSSSSSHLTSKSLILLHQKSINSMTKSFFITRFIKTSYMTIHDLFIKFHDEFRFSSLIIIQNSLSFVSSTEQHMRTRQTRITSYFKSAINDFTSRSFITTNSMIKLISNKKHADLKVFVKSIWIDHLTSKISFDNHSITHHTCRRCSQHFIFENMLHKHIRHCSKDINRWLLARNLTKDRHFFNCTNILSFSLLAHVE